MRTRTILFCLFVGIMTMAGCAGDDGAISSMSERVEASGPSDVDPGPAGRVGSDRHLGVHVTDTSVDDGGAVQAGHRDPAARGEAPATSRQADKIRICHRTNSDANPYVAMEVSERALAGHLDHPEDIIPPSHLHDGQNFPSPLWHNGCVTPEPTPTETATPEPTPTETATPEPTATATPEPTPTETATPEPTATATATPEPTPTATATPEEQTAGSIEEDVEGSADTASGAAATPAAPNQTAPSDLGGGGDELARTGASSGELGLIAALLVMAGTAMVAVGRRLATPETR